MAGGTRRRREPKSIRSITRVSAVWGTYDESKNCYRWFFHRGDRTRAASVDVRRPGRAPPNRRTARLAGRKVDRLRREHDRCAGKLPPQRDLSRSIERRRIAAPQRWKETGRRSGVVAGWEDHRVCLRPRWSTEAGLALRRRCGQLAQADEP